MRKRHFVLPLIPLGAIWAYVFTQSAGQFYELMEAAPRAAAAAPAVADADLQTDAQIITGAERAAAAAYSVLPAFEIEEAPVADPYAEPAYRYEDPYSLQYGEYPYEGTPAEIPHPEVTDPAMRKLLAPAWAD